MRVHLLYRMYLISYGAEVNDRLIYDEYKEKLNHSCSKNIDRNNAKGIIIPIILLIL